MVFYTQKAQFAPFDNSTRQKKGGNTSALKTINMTKFYSTIMFFTTTPSAVVILTM